MDQSLVHTISWGTSWTNGPESPRLWHAPNPLRGPIAILFISRDAFSDSIATFSGLFSWGIAQVSRDMLQMGYRTDMSV